MTDFEELYERHRGIVYGYLYKLCGDSVLAEELMQETFFMAYINVASLREREKAASWLCQIAKNTYFAWYNAQKKHVNLEESMEIKGSIDIEQQFVDKELSEKALACLHKLDEPYKEVFMLTVLGQVSLKDISRIFGKSESWARVTFYRAKQKLAERMNEIYE